MSGFKVNFSVNNQLATPSIHAAPLAQRPAFGQPGRVFIDTDAPSTGIYRDTGSAWVQIASTSSPEADTLQTVTDRGNTTTNDIAIGTSSNPSAPLDVHGTDVIAILQASGSSNGFLQFNKSGSGKFKVGNVHNSGNDYFTVYNLQENSDAILVNISTNNVAIGGHTVTPTYKLDIAGSLANTGSAYLGTSGNDVGIGTTSPGTYLAGVAGATIFRSGVSTGLSIASSSSNYILQYLNGSGHFVKFAGPTAQRVSTQFLSTGNLNIGTSTADAGYKVDIGGSFRMTNNSSNAAVFDMGLTGIFKILRNSVAHFQYDASTYTVTAYQLQSVNLNTYVGGAGRTRIAGGAFELQGGGYVAGLSQEILLQRNTPGTTNAVNVVINDDGTTVHSNYKPLVVKVNSVEKTHFDQYGAGHFGTSTSETLAILSATSTTKGFLPPRMTTTQKNAIANTAGLVVFDTTLAKLCVNSGAGWETITSV